MLNYYNAEDVYSYINSLSNINNDVYDNIIKNEVELFEQFKVDFDTIVNSDEYNQHQQIYSDVIALDNKLYSQYTNSDEYKEVIRLQKELDNAAFALSLKKQKLLSENKNKLQSNLEILKNTDINQKHLCLIF